MWRRLVAISAVGLTVAGGLLSVVALRAHTTPGSIQRARVTDRRCRGGCAPPLLSVLPYGALPSQQAAGTLQTSSGVPVTDTRASSVYCTNSSGTLVLLGNNAPCVEASGLRVEGSATNLAIQSQALGTAPWSSIGSPTVAAATNGTSDVTAPDGSQTATKIVLGAVSTGTQFSLVRQSITTTAAAYTWSVYLRTLSGTATVWVSFGDVTNDANQLCALTTAWTRCALANHTLTAAAHNFDLGVNLNNSGSGETAEPAQTVYAWGAQVETGSFASSYIPTTTVTVTRAADSLTLPNPLTNGGTWCLAATVLPYALLPVTQGIVGLGTSYGSANFALLNLNTSGFPALYIFDSGAVQHAANGGSTISVASHRIAGATVGGAMTLYVDGASAGTQTGGVMASQPATIMLGQQQSGGTGPFNGHLYNICVDPSPTRCR